MVNKFTEIFQKRPAILYIGDPDVTLAQIELMSETWEKFNEDKRVGKVDYAMLQAYYGLGPKCGPEDLWKQYAQLQRNYSTEMWRRPNLETMMGPDTIQIPIATPVESHLVGKIESSTCVGGGAQPLIVVVENKQRAQILDVMRRGILSREDYRANDWDPGWVEGRVLRMPLFDGQDDIIDHNFLNIPCNDDLGHRYLEWYIEQILDRKAGKYDPTMPVHELVILQDVDQLIESGKMEANKIRELWGLSGATGEVGSICVAMMMSPMEYTKMLMIGRERNMAVGGRVLVGKISQDAARIIGKNLHQPQLEKMVNQMHETQGITIVGGKISVNWLIES